MQQYPTEFLNSLVHLTAPDYYDRSAEDPNDYVPVDPSVAEYFGVPVPRYRWFLLYSQSVLITLQPGDRFYSYGVRYPGPPHDFLDPFDPSTWSIEAKEEEPVLVDRPPSSSLSVSQSKTSIEDSRDMELRHKIESKRPPILKKGPGLFTLQESKPIAPNNNDKPSSYSTISEHQTPIQDRKSQSTKRNHGETPYVTKSIQESTSPCTKSTSYGQSAIECEPVLSPPWTEAEYSTQPMATAKETLPSMKKKQRPVITLQNDLFINPLPSPSIILSASKPSSSSSTRSSCPSHPSILSTPSTFSSGIFSFSTGQTPLTSPHKSIFSAATPSSVSDYATSVRSTPSKPVHTYQSEGPSVYFPTLTQVQTQESSPSKEQFNLSQQSLLLKEEEDSEDSYVLNPVNLSTSSSSSDYSTSTLVVNPPMNQALDPSSTQTIANPSPSSKNEKTEVISKESSAPSPTKPQSSLKYHSTYRFASSIPSPSVHRTLTTLKPSQKGSTMKSGLFDSPKSTATKPYTSSAIKSATATKSATSKPLNSSTVKSTTATKSATSKPLNSSTVKSTTATKSFNSSTVKSTTATKSATSKPFNSSSPTNPPSLSSKSQSRPVKLPRVALLGLQKQQSSPSKKNSTLSSSSNTLSTSMRKDLKGSSSKQLSNSIKKSPSTLNQKKPASLSGVKTNGIITKEKKELSTPPVPTKKRTVVMSAMITPSSSGLSL